MLVSYLSLVLTHCSRLCLEQSIGLLPVTISSSRTPKANMSVFSSTMPCMKYSGAKYLRSQSDFCLSRNAMCLNYYGFKMSILFLPKCAFYGYDRMVSPLLWEPLCQTEVWNLLQIRQPSVVIAYASKEENYLFGQKTICLRFKVIAKKHIGCLDIAMDDPMLAEHMQILQAPRNTDRNLVPQRPLKSYSTLPCKIGSLLSHNYSRILLLSEKMMIYTVLLNEIRYHAVPMLGCHLHRTRISGTTHSQRSIQEGRMCSDGIHAPESLALPGTLSPSAHWACLLLASSQLYVGHQTGCPCILLHSLLFQPCYLKANHRKLKMTILHSDLDVSFLWHQISSGKLSHYIRIAELLKT